MDLPPDDEHRRHVFESEMKEVRRTLGRDGHDSRPDEEPAG